jgi:hypothetical protein
MKSDAQFNKFPTPQTSRADEAVSTAVTPSIRAAGEDFPRPLPAGGRDVGEGVSGHGATLRVRALWQELLSS